MNSNIIGKDWIQAELTGPEPEKTLYILNRAGIRLYRICWIDSLCVRFFCERRNCRRIEILCTKRGESVIFTPDPEAFSLKKWILKRPVLKIGLAAMLLLTFYLPTRVLFFTVEGNQNIPSHQILEVMEECGIRFGASRRKVRSEKMKNALLEAMPELKWAGINTSGCTAVVSVRERDTQPHQKRLNGVSSIAAAVDGYITSGTVLKGTGLFQPGQIVRAGQLLISGYIDLGTHVQAAAAEGEVYAQTVRTFHGVGLSEKQKRVEVSARETRVSLIIGKKRINFWKDSRIWDATCGRMYEEYYMTLPGGFRLPVSLTVETWTHWKTETTDILAADMEANMKAYARDMVLQQTIAGRIHGQEDIFSGGKGVYFLDSRFLCTEMIGRVITEEIGEANGKTD